MTDQWLPQFLQRWKATIRVQGWPVGEELELWLMAWEDAIRDNGITEYEAEQARRRVSISETPLPFKGQQIGAMLKAVRDARAAARSKEVAERIEAERRKRKGGTQGNESALFAELPEDEQKPWIARAQELSPKSFGSNHRWVRVLAAKLYYKAVIVTEPSPDEWDWQ